MDAETNPIPTPDHEAAIAEAERVLGRASMQHRVALENARPHLERLQQAEAVLDQAQVRLHQLLQASAEGALP